MRRAPPTLQGAQSAAAARAARADLRPRLAASASGTMTGMSVGAECAYSTSKSALVKYAAACQYVQPDFTVSMKL